MGVFRCGYMANVSFQTVAESFKWARFIVPDGIGYEALECIEYSTAKKPHFAKTPSGSWILINGHKF